MSFKHVTSIWILRIALILILIGISFYFINLSNRIEQKTAIPEVAVINNIQQIPEEITPEGVIELKSQHIPFLLIDADNPYPKNMSSPGPTRLIYYTKTPSFRSAKAMVRQDRESKPTGFLDAIKLNSQRLTGTPIEWQRLNLEFLISPYPTEAQTISPRQLSEAIKDSIEMQVIDSRPLLPGENNTSPFPNTLRLMPDQVLNNLDKLSKEKWTVLVGFDTHSTQIMAFELFKKGYLLTTVLEGGYPAWVAATDR